MIVPARGVEGGQVCNDACEGVRGWRAARFTRPSQYGERSATITKETHQQPQHKWAVQNRKK